MNLNFFKYISFKYILILSVFLFFFSYLYYDINDFQEYPSLSIIGNIIAAVLAVFWVCINYIDHLRLNPLYRDFNNIDKFIKDMNIEKDEKNEISQMMYDYVEDKMKQGVDETQATIEIIKQFQKQELESKNEKIFYLHKHYYILNYGVILIILATLVYIVGEVLLEIYSPITNALEVTAISYGVGFLVTYVLYFIFNKILLYKY